nr:MAG TPA: hypothetical protein [Caudoviricetes sp.]
MLFFWLQNGNNRTDGVNTKYNNHLQKQFHSGYTVTLFSGKN